MRIGGLIGSRRLAEEMSHGITEMNKGEGFTAKLVTSGLALATSFASLPVSTTHVPRGSHFDIGAARHVTRKAAFVSIHLAWLATEPIALGFVWTVQDPMSSVRQRRCDSASPRQPGTQERELCASTLEFRGYPGMDTMRG